MRAGETVFSLRVCFCAASGLVVQMNHCNSAALREYSKGAARCRGCKGEMFRRDIMSESALITIHTLNRAELPHTQTCSAAEADTSTSPGSLLHTEVLALGLVTFSYATNNNSA